MAKGKGIPTEAQKAKKSRQPLNTTANKARKLAKHVRRHPNDKQAVSGGSNEERRNVSNLRSKSGLQRLSGLSQVPNQEAVQNRPPRFKQVNEEHLGLVRISAATLLKLHQYKNILLGSSQSLAEANQEFSTDPLK